MLTPSPARAGDARPSLDGAPDLGSKYVTHMRLQKTGYSFLASGFGQALVGVAFVEIDAWGDLGTAGFAVLGSGLGVAIIGMFFVGLSHPESHFGVASRGPPGAWTLAAAPSEEGAHLSCTVAF
jgi:hypothetical protein